MRGFRAAMAALACAVGLSAYGQTVLSYSIDGPDTIDAASQLSATYSVTAHWSDGTTSTVTGPNSLTSFDSTILARATPGAFQPTVTFVPASIGIGGLYYTFLDGTSITKKVLVNYGAGPSGSISTDCPSESAGPWQQYYPSRVYLGRATDVLPLCGTQVLVANEGFSAIQAVDLATGQLLKNYEVPAVPRILLKVPGTAFIAAALEDGTVVLIDTSLDRLQYITLPRAGTIAAFEPGQLIAISDAYGSNPSNVDATVIDVRTAGTSVAHPAVTLQLPGTVAPGKSLFRYDAAHHRFVLGQTQATHVVNGTYDTSSGQLQLGATGAPALSTFDIAMSPDGQHVATSTQTGNLPYDPSGFSYAGDYAASDLTTPAGRFRFDFNGTSPYGIDFGADGTKVFGSNGVINFVFDPASHRVRTAWLGAPPPANFQDPCVSGGTSRLRASPGGRYVESLRDCSTYGAIDWSQVLGASDPLPPPLPAHNVTIDGPSTLSVSDGAATYVATLHNGDGSTMPIVPSSASSQVLRWAGSQFVITGPGTVVMYDSFSGAQAFVRVQDAAAPTDPIALDCPDDPVDAGIPAGGRKSIVPLANYVLPLCGTQVIVANAAMNRVDVRDIGSNARLLRSWPLAAAPLMMVRIPGTSLLVVALDNWTLARIDMASGDVQTVAAPHGVWSLVTLEGGQVFVYSTDEVVGTNPATAAYAYVLDANTMALRQAAWPLAPIWQGNSSAGHYDAGRHVLYFQRGEYADVSKLAYDAATATFTPLTQSVPETSFGSDFALSPDGTHLHAIAYYWNGTQPLSLYDISTTNMVDVLGTFSPDPNRTLSGALDLRFDGAQLLAGRLDAVVAFDTASHAPLGGWAFDNNFCQGNQQVRWSPHGRYVLARNSCTPGASGFYIFPAASMVPRQSTTLTLSRIGSAVPPNGTLSVDFNVTLTSTGSVGTPSGGFTLFDGSVVLGACGGPPSNGCRFVLGYGSHALHAEYTGDPLYLPSTSNVVNVSVPAPVSMALISQQNPTAANQPMSFTALLTSPGGVPVGTVSFFADGSAIPGCTSVTVMAPASPGVTMSTAACPWGSKVVGVHAITANYSGDATYSPATAQLSQTVQLSLNETNWALASNGGVASASSQLSADFPVRSINDGDTLGANWTHGGGWADNTFDQWPDIVQIDFNAPKLIDHVVLYTVQDNWQTPSPVTDTLTFTQLGITAFDVQGWDGSTWQTLASVSGNNLVKRAVTFTPFNTTKIRVVVQGSLYYVSRIVELEAWGVPGDATDTNWALSYYGGIASASSQLGAAYPVAAINDGETSGRNWTQGGGWADGTISQWPDSVDIEYPQPRSIDRVVVYTVQDDYANPVQPTDATTFTQYGVTDFNVQGWNGTQWVTLATVTGNRQVKRTVSFTPFSTTRIRVNVTGALWYVSRITEVETWGGNASPPPVGETNVALAANGGFASASSQLGGDFPIGAINDGERAGANWTHGGGWADGTVSQWPDWVQVDFKGAQAIDRVVVYTLQDLYQNPVEPTDTTTFGTYGITDFLVQGWDGARWVTLGTVSGNNLVKRTVTFTPFTTTKIRILVTNSLYYVSRITEVEAWGVPAGPAPANVALSSAGGVVTVSSQLTPQANDFNPASINDGDIAGRDWTHGGGWADGTVSQWPDWAQVDFAGAQAISRVVVYTVQDDYANGIVPTDKTTFTQYGITDFQVQAWDGAQWVTLATVANNNLVKRTVVFDPYITTKIRVLVTNSLYYVSRIVEVEAWGFSAAVPQSCPTASGPAPVDFTLPGYGGIGFQYLASGRIGAATLGALPQGLGSERINVAITTASPVSGTWEMTISPCKGVIDPTAGFCYMSGMPGPNVAYIEWTPGTVPPGFPACHVDAMKTNYVNLRYTYSSSSCPAGTCDYAVSVSQGILSP